MARSVTSLARVGYLACLALSISAGAAGAQPALLPAGLNAQGSTLFDIPAEGLGEALDQFSRTTGLAVLVDSAMARRGTQAVHGRYAAQDALRRLLTGTGLQARYMNTRSIIVTEAPPILPKSTQNPPAPPPLAVADLPGVAAGASDQQIYLVRLQTELTRALCRSNLTRPGGYRLALQLRLKPNGDVDRMRLLDSSGDAARDAAITRMLGSLAVGATPPASLPQPVSLLLLPEGPHAETNCPAPAP